MILEAKGPYLSFLLDEFLNMPVRQNSRFII